MTKKKIVNLKSEEYPEWLDPDLWKDFVAHRAMLGKPMTPIAEKRMFKKLDKLRGEYNIEDTINQSITRNWLDVYPKKQQIQDVPRGTLQEFNADDQV